MATSASPRCHLLDSSNVRQLLDSVDVILSDCDGVLWTTDSVVPGAPEAVRKLKAMGKKVLYVTNNSNKSRQEYVKKFLSLGYHVIDDEIYAAAYVTAEYLKHKLKYTGKVYCIGSQGLADELKLCNIYPTEIGPDTMEGKSLTDLENYQLDPSVKCVVVGLDYDFTFVKAAKAAMYLQDKKCLFVATNSDSNLPTSSGRIMPCAGSMLAMVQTASQRRPDAICGKPNQPMYDIIAAHHKLDRHRTLMIGDRLNTDILFAGRAGFQSLMTLTGVSTLDDVRCKENSMADEDQRSIPHYFIPSLGDLATLI